MIGFRQHGSRKAYKNHGIGNSKLHPEIERIIVNDISLRMLRSVARTGLVFSNRKMRSHFSHAA